MNIEIDAKTSLTFAAFLATAAVFWYTQHRTTNVLLKQILREPDVPNIAQIARLEPDTGFKVVTGDSYRALTAQTQATAKLPEEVRQLQARIRVITTRLDELGGKVEAVGPAIQTVKGAVQENFSAMEHFQTNCKAGFEAILDAIDGGYQ
jgi:hypothetical protein